MVANAHGRPLCKHSRPDWRRRNPAYNAHCTLWCEWRTVTLYIVLPTLIIIAALFAFVPHAMMFGFQ